MVFGSTRATTGMATSLAHPLVPWLHPSRRRFTPPQDEVLDPHGEERGNAARLEPRGHGIRRRDSTQAADKKAAAVPQRNCSPSNSPVLRHASIYLKYANAPAGWPTLSRAAGPGSRPSLL